MLFVFIISLSYLSFISPFSPLFSVLTEAIKNIIQYIGMQPCERSDKVPEGKSAHSLYLAGVFRGGHDALVRAKLALDASGVTMQLTVRSSDPNVSEVLATAVA